MWVILAACLLIFHLTGKEHQEPLVFTHHSRNPPPLESNIHQILPLTPAGIVLRMSGKRREQYEIGFVRYLVKLSIIGKSMIEDLLVEAASILQLVLPRDIVFNNVVPFLELPLYEFELGEEDEEEESGDDGSSNDGGESYDSSEVLDSADDFFLRRRCVGR